MSAISPQDWQDQEDGRALRMLSAAPGTWTVANVQSRGGTTGYAVEAWAPPATGKAARKVLGPDDDSMPEVHPTIAAAADAARKALEAIR